MARESQTVMLKALKQARSAVGMLNPDEVGRRARQPVRIGLVAFDGAGYAAMEEFLGPALEHVYRAGDPGVPDKVDLVLYQQGISLPAGRLRSQIRRPFGHTSRRFCATMRIWSWRWRASLRHSGSRWWRASSTQCRGRTRCSRWLRRCPTWFRASATPLGVRRIRLRHGHS